MNEGVHIRARHARSNLDEIDALGPGIARRIRERIPKDMLDEVMRSTAMRWLPVEIDIEMTRAVQAELGAAGLRRWARDALVRSAESPLLTPLFASARTLFGATPHALFRVVRHGYATIYRNGGILEYERVADTVAHLIHDPVPQSFLDESWYLEGVAGALEATFVVFEREGSCTTRIETNRVVYEASWLD